MVYLHLTSRYGCRNVEKGTRCCSHWWIVWSCLICMPRRVSCYAVCHCNWFVMSEINQNVDIQSSVYCVTTINSNWIIIIIFLIGSWSTNGLSRSRSTSLPDNTFYSKKERKRGEKKPYFAFNIKSDHWNSSLIKHEIIKEKKSTITDF